MKNHREKNFTSRIRLRPQFGPLLPDYYDFWNMHQYPAQHIAGKFTVPFDGYFLIQSKVQANGGWASYHILVDGTDVSFIYEAEGGTSTQSTSPAAVMHFTKGQQISVRPAFKGNINGGPGYLSTYFGATLLFMG